MERIFVVGKSKEEPSQLFVQEQDDLDRVTGIGINWRKTVGGLGRLIKKVTGGEDWVIINTSKYNLENRPLSKADHAKIANIVSGSK